jgi:hypothetical protein
MMEPVSSKITYRVKELAPLLQLLSPIPILRTGHAELVRKLKLSDMNLI